MSAEPGQGRGRGARGRGGRFQTSPAVRRSQTAGSNPTSTTEPGTQRGKKKGGGPNSPTQASDLAANPSEDSAHNDADTGEVEGGPGGMETTTAQGDGPPAGPVNPNATPFTPQSIQPTGTAISSTAAIKGEVEIIKPGFRWSDEEEPETSTGGNGGGPKEGCEDDDEMKHTEVHDDMEGRWLSESSLSKDSFLTGANGEKHCIQTCESLRRWKPEPKAVQAIVKDLTSVGDGRRPTITAVTRNKLLRLIDGLCHLSTLYSPRDVIDLTFQDVMVKKGAHVPQCLAPGSQMTQAEENDFTLLGFAPAQKVAANQSQEQSDRRSKSSDEWSKPASAAEGAQQFNTMRDDAINRIKDLCRAAGIPLSAWRSEHGWPDHVFVQHAGKIWNVVQEKLLDTVEILIRDTFHVTSRQIDDDQITGIQELKSTQDYHAHVHMHTPRDMLDVVCGVHAVGADSLHRFLNSCRSPSVRDAVKAEHEYWDMEVIPKSASPATDLAYLKRKTEARNQALGTATSVYGRDGALMMAGVMQRKDPALATQWSQANYTDLTQKIVDIVVDNAGGGVRSTDEIEAESNTVQNILERLAADRTLDAGPEFENEVAKIKKLTKIGGGGVAGANTGGASGRSKPAKAKKKGKERIGDPNGTHIEIPNLSENRVKRVNKLLVTQRDDGLYELGLKTIAGEYNRRGSAGPLGRLAKLIKVEKGPKGYDEVTWRADKVNKLSEQEVRDFDDYQLAVIQIVDNSFDSAVRSTRRKLLDEFKKDSRKKKKTGGGAKKGGAKDSLRADGGDDGSDDSSTGSGSAAPPPTRKQTQSQSGPELYELVKGKDGSSYFLSRSTNEIVPAEHALEGMDGDGFSQPGDSDTRLDRIENHLAGISALVNAKAGNN